MKYNIIVTRTHRYIVSRDGEKLESFTSFAEAVRYFQIVSKEVACVCDVMFE